MSEPTPIAATTLPPFDVLRFRRRVAIDALIRGCVLTMALVAGVWIVFIHGDAGEPLRFKGLTLDPLLALVLAMAPWIGLNVIGAKAMHETRMAGSHLSRGAGDDAEAALAAATRRRPLSRRAHALRLRQLAELRHFQRRYAEVVVICRELLAGSRGRPDDPSVKAQGLIMLTEAALECGSLADAYWGLTALHAMPLRLDQRLTQMLLQTHYEVLIGADASAMHEWRRKAELSELMPQPLCGMQHAFLAAAAVRADHQEAAAWLTARAKLMAPRQLRHVFGRLGMPPAAMRISAGPPGSR